MILIIKRRRGEHLGQAFEPRFIGSLPCHEVVAAVLSNVH